MSVGQGGRGSESRTKLDGIAEQLALELVGLDPDSIVDDCERVRCVALEGAPKSAAS